MPNPPLPKYVCHKEVEALKIANVVHIGYIAEKGGTFYRLEFAETGYVPINVEAEWVDKHGPKKGGYYVVYKDGYTSFSPARAFEEGYTAVQDPVTAAQARTIERAGAIPADAERDGLHGERE